MMQHRNKTILVVDDEKILVEIAVDSLEDGGYKIVEAYDGEMALAILRSGIPIELVFSDIKMPKMDGIALLKQIREEFPQVPVCMVSGFSGKTEEDVLALGAIAYISKPYSPEALIAVAGKAFDTTISEPMTTSKRSPALVYIVEDDEIDQNLLKRGFSKQAWKDEVTLKFFPTGESLLSEICIKRTCPSLIVFDINLPGMSGFETLSALRKANQLSPETKVIVLSGSRLESDQRRSRELGVDCFFQKPSRLESWWHIARSIGQSWLQLGDKDCVSHKESI